MTVLARKIARAKWDGSKDLGKGEISADVITADLRTTNNSLSFWRRGTADESDLRNAILALATGADRADRIDIAWIEEAIVKQRGIATKPTLGRTPVTGLRETHVDLVRLDARRLVVVAELISDAVRRNNHRRKTKSEVVAIVTDAVREGRVNLNELQPGLRHAVEAALGDVERGNLASWFLAGVRWLRRLWGDRLGGD